MKRINFIKYAAIIAFFIFTACCGSQEKKPLYKTGDTVDVLGIVSMTGSEPMTRMVVRSSDKRASFFLPKEYKGKRNNLIGKSVNVSGKIEVKELKSADNKYTVYEYHIIPDKIEEAGSQTLK